MSWRPAKSIATFLKQVNEEWPNRDKTSDGIIGDTRHQAEKSDHNPNAAGVVRAIDISVPLSPTQNVDILVADLLASRDPRISYIIWNRRMVSSYKAKDGTPAWEWRPYHGFSPHTEHMHLSVSPDAKLYDDASEWNLFGIPTTPLPTPIRDLKKGDKGDDVKALQEALKITADGIFGPATEKAVRNFQSVRGLRADGIVGHNTRRELGI